MALLKFQADSHWTSAAPAVKIRTGKHELMIDEPASVGGTDLGPNPLQYVIAALAGCVTIVGKGVAKKMGINLEEVSIRIEGEIDPDGFSGKDPSVQKGFKEMRLIVTAKADCPPEKLREWLKTTEDLCPVGNTLRDGTSVKMALA